MTIYDRMVDGLNEFMADLEKFNKIDIARP